MSTIKTTISSEELQQITSKLSKYFPSNPEIISIKGGEISQAFILKCNKSNTDLILRINSRNGRGFWKDKYAYTHFAKFGIKIPRIIENEKSDKYYYSLSEKCSGKLLDEISVFEGREVQKDLFKILLTLFSIEPIGVGYGSWDETLQAKYTSISELIAYDLRVEPEDTVERSFSNLKLHENIRQKASRFEKYLIQKRYLIHGDIGFNNACAKNGKITGLFDWMESSYRDFVNDIAWLMFWNTNKLDSNNEFRKYFESLSPTKKPDLDFTNYNERLQYALLTIGYGSLCFFAKSGQEISYKETVQIMKNLKLI